MPDPPNPLRFQIALSFPGEHRSRVEAIANALAKELGKEKILYDKWYEAELARPNLDKYLVNLYHDHSRLLVFFHCEEYDQKEWCGLEDRAGRDLLKHRQDDRLMFLRLDQAGSNGRLSIDGYMDIRNMPDAEVAAQILQRLHLLDPVAPTPPAVRTFTANLPAVDTLLIGRETELAFLERAWTESANIVQIIAPGGTGKTALMDKWFRRHLNEVTIFGWSFYSQGTQQDRQTSSDPFFAEILPFFDITIREGSSVWARAEAIAARLRQERVLLILDGMEPLQESTGELRDSPLKALLQELRTHNSGMILCTTRVRIKELPDDEHCRSGDLENLQPKDGARLLEHLGVTGTAKELEGASHDYGNHALALTLLGTYLRDFHRGDIGHRSEIRGLLTEETDADGHANRVMASYTKMFEGKPELQVLRALGYFDRPAEPEAIRLVLAKMEHQKYQAALVRLSKARLVLTTDPTEDLDCHPLVREYFASVIRATTPDEFKHGHSLLCGHYSNKAPELPDTREAMVPLFYAVYHACQAERYGEAITSVYFERILRRDKNFLSTSLGELGTNLSVIANFFATPSTHPANGLSRFDRSWVLFEAASTMESLGRLKDAVAPLRASAEDDLKRNDRQGAAIGHSRLSFLYGSLGNLDGAVALGEKAVSLADSHGSKFTRWSTRAVFASILHQCGRLKEAATLFREAEDIQAQGDPAKPMIYATSGYHYCDLMLEDGQHPEVLRRAVFALKMAEPNHWLRAIGLGNLLLGRAHPQGSLESQIYLDEAVKFLRKAGNFNRLPLALLARATDHDLEEAFTIATRSGMRLHLADYHLIQARRLKSVDLNQAIDHFKEAERLINETGYHRRDQSLADLRKDLFPHQPHPA